MRADSLRSAEAAAGSIFNSDPEVVATGYDPAGHARRFSAHSFSLLYEVMSGYLRGFGISLGPAHADDAGRVRACASAVDPAGLPARAGRSARSCSAYPVSLSTHGADDLHRARMLSPQPEKGRLRAGKERLTARLSSFSAQTASATFHRWHTPSPTLHDARRGKSSDEPPRRFSALRAPF